MKATRTIQRTERPDQAGPSDPAWREAYPLQYFTMPRCPRCRHHVVPIRTSEPQGDGSKLEYRTCRACGLAFKSVSE